MPTLDIVISSGRQVGSTAWMSTLCRDFDIQVRMVKANVDTDYGWLQLQFTGPVEEMQRAVAWLMTTGMHVESQQRALGVFVNEPQPYAPPGFDEFWRGNVAEAESAPLEYSISTEIAHPVPTRDGQTNPGTVSTDHEIRTFQFRSIAGESLSGWIATPPQALSTRPAFLWVAPYGRESLMPNQYGTRKGFVSLSFNFFGNDAFHQEKYEPARGYFAEGVATKETWIFRSMFQNAVIALRVLSSLEAVDPARIGSVGMSQGAGMSIWLGAWSDRVKAVCADMPFLGAMRDTLLQNIYRYPLKELTDSMDSIGGDRVLETIAFFDTLNQASRCRKPTLVSVGLKDPAVKPIQVQAIYAALKGPKRLFSYDWGHDWHPDMVDNNRDWLIQNLDVKTNAP